MFKLCPKCSTVNDGWNFCPSCGTKLNPITPVNENVDKLEEEKINEELNTLNGIIAKFNEELEDAEADEQTLLSLPVSERKKPDYQKAWEAVQTRKDDITFSLQLVYRRMQNLKNTD